MRKLGINQTRKTMRFILAMVLAACMCCALVPMPALAETAEVTEGRELDVAGDMHGERARQEVGGDVGLSEEQEPTPEEEMGGSPTLLTAQSSNPYPQFNWYNSTTSYQISCTWYAWQQAYDRLGVSIPGNWGNGGQWYDSANAIGWTTGTKPLTNSLAVWRPDATNGYGHVAYVTWAAADGSSFTVNEGGSYDSRANWEGIYVGHTIPDGYTRWPDGFVYFSEVLDQPPIGMVASCECTGNHLLRVRGWAYDPDVPNDYIRFHVYVGGKADGGGKCYTHDAVGNELHANQQFISQGMSEFDYTLYVNETGNQPIYIYAINHAPGGTNTELNGSGGIVNITRDEVAPTISNVRVTGVWAGGYTVSCTVTDNVGVDRVQFPTWTASGDQDDIAAEWWTNPSVRGIRNGDTWTFRVYATDHNNDAGTYLTHIYAYDAEGNHACDNSVSAELAYPSDVPAESGRYTLRSALDTNKALDVWGASLDNDANLAIWSWNGGLNEQFDLARRSDGYYTLTAAHSGKAVEVGAASREDGAALGQYAANGTPAQQWIIHANADGTYTLRNRASGLCMDVRDGDTTNGTVVQQWTYAVSPIQKWHLVPTDVSKWSISVASQAVTGGVVNPVLNVNAGGVAMRQGEDYTVSSMNVAGAGMAAVTIAGKGGFTGTKSATFRVSARSQWVKLGGSWYYYGADGAASRGWLKSGNSWYYLDPATGAMRTGWLKDGGRWYYLDPANDSRMATGWLKVNGYWYLFAAGGQMLSGWQKVGNSWYYLDPANDSRMATGWLKVNGYWYLFAGGGQMLSGWQRSGGSWYYLDPANDSRMATGWLKVNGHWYLFAAGGQMLSGWQKVGNSWYYLDPANDSRMATGWCKVGDWWYLFAAGGQMLSGWQKSGGSWYYLDPANDSRMATGWLKVNGYWYLFAGGGQMLSGWQKSGGKWYYLNPANDSRMVTGRQRIDGKWHNFDSSGVWIGESIVMASGGSWTIELPAYWTNKVRIVKDNYGYKVYAKNFPHYDVLPTPVERQGILVNISEGGPYATSSSKGITNIMSGQQATFLNGEYGVVSQVHLGGGRYLTVTTYKPMFAFDVSDLMIPKIPKQTYDAGVALAWDLMTFGDTSKEPDMTCVEGIAALTLVLS